MRQLYVDIGAGDGNRTHVISLEGWSSTIELHPHEIEDRLTYPPEGVQHHSEFSGLTRRILPTICRICRNTDSIAGAPAGVPSLILPGVLHSWKRERYYLARE